VNTPKSSEVKKLYSLFIKEREKEMILGRDE
jgi:hypothetical protein